MNWYSQIKSIFQNQPLSLRRTGLATDTATQKKTNLFTIAGGDILVYGIIGHVMANGAASGQTASLGHTPTGGIRAVIATAVNGSAAVKDVIFTFNGVIGGALVVAQAGAVVGVGAVNGTVAGVNGPSNVFAPGTIDMTTAAFNETTQLIDWEIIYKPLSVGATVTVQ